MTRVFSSLDGGAGKVYLGGIMHTYQIHYLNRRDAHVWDIPLAGITVSRPSLLVPAVAARGLVPLRLDEDKARSLAQKLNDRIAFRKMPGKCFAVWVGDEKV